MSSEHQSTIDACRATVRASRELAAQMDAVTRQTQQYIDRLWGLLRQVEAVIPSTSRRQQTCLDELKDQTPQDLADQFAQLATKSALAPEPDGLHVLEELARMMPKFKA